MSDQFISVIKELSTYFECELVPDYRNNVVVGLPDGVEIHFSIDKMGEFLCIGTRLIELPTFGSFRDQVFITALAANAQLPLRSGILGYSEQTHRLILFDKIPMENISGSKVIATLEPFIEKARVWIKALKRSEVPIIDESLSASKGVFGLL